MGVSGRGLVLVRVLELGRARARLPLVPDLARGRRWVWGKDRDLVLFRGIYSAGAHPLVLVWGQGRVLDVVLVLEPPLVNWVSDLVVSMVVRAMGRCWAGQRSAHQGNYLERIPLDYFVVMDCLPYRVLSLLS